MPNIIMADQPSGGEFPTGTYLKIWAKECTIEDNNGVTNTANAQRYLKTLSGLPGDFMAFTLVDAIESPVGNEIASAGTLGIYAPSAARCWRYKNSSWSLVDWNSASYDARLVGGKKVIVYTWQKVSPT